VVVAHINAVSTAVPENDIHAAYLAEIVGRLERREAALFKRMASRSGIAHRFSFFAPAQATGEACDSEGFFRHGDYPGTGTRMTRYERGPLRWRWPRSEVSISSGGRSRI
jgi:hypothetical protein